MRTRKWLGLGVLVAAVALAGCTDQKSSAPTTKPTQAEGDDDHDHGPGPHQGTVIELEGSYHGEFVADHGKKQATVYVLDGSAKKVKPVAADKILLSIKTPQFQIELKPFPLETDPKGKCSRFVGTHDHLGKEQEFEGTISLTIDGTPYAGDFKEKPHKDGKK
jgi:hypothetical protein